MGRFFISPFFPAFGENIEISGEKFLQIFEKRENVEKLIKAVEELSRKDEARKKAEKLERLERKKVEADTGGTPERKGWRRYLPF